MEHIRFHGFPVAGIDAMTAATSRSFPKHTHDQYGIGVIDWGAHASWSGRGHVEAEPGNLICVNPGEVHDGRAIGEQPRSWRLLYLEPAVVEATCADIMEGAHVSFMFTAPVFADEQVRQLFDAAFRLAAEPATPAAGMAGETALLALMACVRPHSTADAKQPKQPAACIRRARARIDEDPAAPLTLAELAKEAGLSRYQLLREFSRAVGLTPHAYILQRRIALARRLIRAGNALAEVAAAAGFCDQSHLTRCFTRQYGVAPRRYARGSG